MHTDKQLPVMTRAQFFAPGEHFHMQISTDFPDYVGVYHRHEYIEVVYVISGSATHILCEQSYDVKRGDFYIINTDATHMFSENKAATEPLIVYDLMFTPAFFDEAQKDADTLEALAGSHLFGNLIGQKTSFGISGGLHTAFGELFNRMYHEYRSKAPGHLEIIRAYLLEVLITALRMQDTVQRNARMLNKKQAVQQVAERIEQEYASDLTVQALADGVYLNPDYLGRIFKEDTGKTITTEIQTVRVRHACRLLQDTQRTVTDIALACGFNDVKFFYSVFKKYMQTSPSVYRRQKQSEMATARSEKTISR